MEMRGESYNDGLGESGPLDLKWEGESRSMRGVTMRLVVFYV